jgi:hypothetical protein
MRHLLLCPFLFLALAITARPVLASDASATTTARLCDQLKQRKVMYVDKTKPDTLWSDGAIFEMARAFPRELQALIDAPTRTQDLHLFLSRMTGKTEEGWQDGSAPRLSRGPEHAVIESADGKIKVRVASAYFNYLNERYPRAKLRVKDNLSPILFVVDGTVRAVVMGKAEVQPQAPKQP